MDKENKDKLHRNQTGKQIILPLVLGLIFIIGMMILMVWYNGKDAEFMAKMSDMTIVMILFLFIILGVISLFLLAMAIEFMRDWIRQVPTYTKIAQQKIEDVEPLINDVLNKSADAVIIPKSWTYGVKKFFTRR